MVLCVEKVEIIAILINGVPIRGMLNILTGQAELIPKILVVIQRVNYFLLLNKFVFVPEFCN